ncbi:MAG TPA: pyridoxal-phosphate dependent enzyme, partial [Thermomicrobiales bacterium]|nr:pyridoxal-phosphate dependent enzyme [Thermomicrobiales bacterium]
MSVSQHPIGVPTRGDWSLPVRCMSCGAVHDGTRPITACPTCGGLLDAVIDTSRKLTPDVFTAEPGSIRATSGVWRYAPLLPEIPEEMLVSRWEGNTPLYVEQRIADYAGLDHGQVRIKHEGHNPTGSFKDRGMTVALSHAKAIGSAMVACASTGNTSASLASYASSTGLPSLVLVPESKISAGKLAQTIAFGATVVQVEGDFDAALRLLRELTADGS